MKTSEHAPSTPRHADSSNRQRMKRRRHPPEPLNDDQYVAASLALIAQLSLRIRGVSYRHG
jgi:hypothetical protein